MCLDIVLWPCNTSCVIIDLAANRARSGDRRVLHRGGYGLTGHSTCVAYTYSQEYIYMFICKCVPVCVTGLVSYQRNGCVGPIRESPAGGDALEMVPWQPPGQGGVCICAALALYCSCGGWR